MPDKTTSDLSASGSNVGHTPVLKNGVLVRTPVSALRDTAHLATEYPSYSYPPAPSSGLIMFSQGTVRRRPAWIDEYGRRSSTMCLVGANKIAYLGARGNSSGTTHSAAPSMVVWNYPFAVTNGPVQRNVGTGNVVLQSKRVGFQTTTTANSQAGVRSTVGFLNGLYGYEVIIRFGVDTWSANMKAFIGVSTTLTQTYMSGNPTALANSIGMSLNPGEVNWSFQANGPTSNVRYDLGSSFPANTQNADLYELRLFCPPVLGATAATSKVFWSVERMMALGPDLGQYAEGVITGGAMIAPTSFVAPQMTFSQSDTQPCTAVLNFIYVETDF